MPKKAWLEKFRQQITEKLGEAEAAQILACVEGVESLPATGKARCIAEALKCLEFCADERLLTDVLHGCACDFPQPRIAAIQRLYRESTDHIDFWTRLAETGLLVEPFEVQDGWVLITKKPYRPDLKASFPSDPFKWYCHCGSIVKPLRGIISANICNCGAGFYRPLFASLFGEPVHIEVRESLVKGDSHCVIGIRIPKIQ